MPASFHHAFHKNRTATASRMVGLVFAIAAGLASPLRAATDEGVTQPDMQDRPASQQLQQEQRQPPLPPLQRELARFQTDRFLQDRQALTRSLFELRERLNSAVRPTPIEIDLLLDLAALHLSQRMLPEARSFLLALPVAGADPAGPGGARMTPIQQGRGIVLAAALDGFSGVDNDVPETWSDAPLFRALAHINRDDRRAAGPWLAQAVEIVRTYPAPLSGPVRIQLLWAAIDSGSWEVARDLAGQMRADDDRNDSAAYRFLLGRAAEVGGDMLAAFDNHAAAAAGSDVWAQRSRIALIDIGRATRTLTAEDARQLLLQTRAIWHGGALGLATLQRLAALELTDRRDLPALDALADIIRLYPGTTEAATAQERAWSVIETIYERGLGGAVPLSEFVAAHRAIAADFRFDQRFDRLAEAFGDHLADSGASGLAATEFGDLHRRIDTRSDAAPRDEATQAALDETRDRLRLKEAAALMQGGRFAEVETLLTPPLVGSDKDLRDRYNLMLAQVFAATDRHTDVLGTRMVAPNGDYLRLRANAAFALSDWAAAREAYEQIWRSQGSAMPTQDRINLLLATHRAGDPGRLHDLIRSFPDLGDHWAGLAAGLNSQAPEVLPLRGDAARERVDNADSALRLLQAAGGNAMP